MPNRPTSSSPLSKRVEAQFGMLTAMFLLGMAVNLIGTPDQVSGGTKAFVGILLGLHVLIALGLIVNAILIFRLASNLSASSRGFARGGGAAVGLATIFGILTLAAPWANFWSYLMAVAFLAAIALYGRLYSSQRLTAKA